VTGIIKIIRWVKLNSKFATTLILQFNNNKHLKTWGNGDLEELHQDFPLKPGTAVSH
jgi:hypothetical protein